MSIQTGIGPTALPFYSTGFNFTPKPYKWIRYATGVVVGAQGDLSFSPDSPHDVVEYDHDLPSESADLYYHTSDAEKQRMFPVDPDMGRTTITSSDATPQRVHLRSDVVKRDGVCFDRLR